MQLCIEKVGYVAAQLSLPDGSQVGILSLDLREDLLVLGTGDRVPRLLDPARPESESVFELKDGRWKVGHDSRISAVALRPDNKGLQERYDIVTGDQAGTLIFWDLPRRTDEPLAVESAFAVDLGGGPVTGLAFHPAGRWLAAADLGGYLHLFDMKKTTCAAGEIFAGGPCGVSSQVAFEEIRALAFSPTGDRLAVAGDALSWWEFAADDDDPLADGEKPVPGASGPILDLAFVPGEDETLATTAGSSVQFWSLAEIGWPIELRGTGAELLSIAFSPDGGLLAAGDGTGHFTVWDMDISRYVCPLTMRDLTPEEWVLNAAGIEPRPICEDQPAG